MTKRDALKKIGNTARKVLKKIVFYIAEMCIYGNMMLYITLRILHIAGAIEYIPGYLRVEGYCTGAVIIAVFILERKQEVREKELKRVVNEAKINDENWKKRISEEMLKNIQILRLKGELSLIQEVKFRQIVESSVKNMEKERKGE